LEDFLEALDITKLVLGVLGIALITKGADWFTNASVNIASATKIPRVIIGATIVSMATTLPEFTASTVSTLQGSKFAVPNAIGSTVCNIGLILGSCVLIRAMAIPNRVIAFKQGIFMLCCGAVATLFAYNGTFAWWEGAILFAGVPLYLIFSIRLARGKHQHAIEDATNSNDEIFSIRWRREISFFLLGAGSVVLGSKFLVDSAVNIAEVLNVPQHVIGILLVAVGTSLPEYATALMATIKGYQELSVGNVIGANILDIVWVIGVNAMIKEQVMPPQAQVLDFPFMLILMVGLIVFGWTKSRLSRWEGGTIFLIYLIYLGIIFTKFI